MKSADLGAKLLRAKASSICREVRGPANVFFWWKQYTDPEGYGILTFLVNGKEKPLQCTDNWTQQAYNLPENQNYIIEWKFAKTSLALNKGAGWIDDINISKVAFPSTPAELHLAYLSPLNDTTKIINSKNKTALINFTFMPMFNKETNVEAILHIYRGRELIQTEKQLSKMENLNYFEYQISEPGNYSWNIEIADILGQHNRSKNRTLKVMRDEIPEISFINLSQGIFIDTTASLQEIKFEQKIIEAQYIPHDDIGIKECNLFIHRDGYLFDSDESHNISNNASNNFSIKFTKPGNYTLKLICKDLSNQECATEGNLSIIPRLIVNSGDNLANAFSKASTEKIKYIHLKNGNFTLEDNIEIMEPFLDISGDRIGEALISGSNNKSTEISVKSNNCSIKGISFKNASIRVLKNNYTITDNNFYNINNIGILVSNVSSIKAERNNFFSKNDKGPSFGIVIFGSQGINISNNIFSNNILVRIEDSTNGLVAKNTFQEAETCTYCNCSDISFQEECHLKC